MRMDGSCVLECPLVLRWVVGWIPLGGQFRFHFHSIVEEFVNMRIVVNNESGRQLSVRVSARVAMGRRIDPSWWTH